MRHNCWLINRTGKRADFTPIDQGQEQNVKDNKVTYRSFGPGARFDYIKKISPAIPTLRGVKEAIRNQFQTLLARGKRHGKPAKDDDVALLVKMYQMLDAHSAHQGGRILRNADDRLKDVSTLGVQEIFNSDTAQRWWQERRKVARASTDIWPHQVDTESEAQLDILANTFLTQ